MDAFRPAMPTNMHHPLCPVCMAPHFPFCPPSHAHTMHPPPRREPFYPGQPVSHMQYDAFHPGQPFARAPHAMPDSKATDFPPHLSYFSQGRPPHLLDNRRDHFPQAPQGQFQSSESFFPGAPHFSQPGEQHLGFNGFMNVDPSRQAGPNSWVEAEREFGLQQQRRAAGMSERTGSDERFLPKTVVAEFPKVDANVKMPEDRLESGIRGDFYQVPEDGRIGRDAAHHTFGTEGSTGVAMGRNQYIPMNDGFGDRSHAGLTKAGELWEGKGLALHPGFPTNYPNTTSGSYSNGRAQPFIPNMAKNVDVSSVFSPVPGSFSTLDEIEKNSCHNYQSSGLPTKEDGTLAEHNPLAHRIVEREGEVLHRRGIQVKAHERREDVQVQEGLDHVSHNKTLKRKHPMTGQQPLSREEELLIEKGLLDDDFSEPHMREPFPYQAQQGNQFMTRSKQGGLGDKGIYFKQPGYQPAVPFSDWDVKGANFGQLGEHNHQAIQSLMPQSERNKKQDVVTDKVAGPKFSNDWPSEDFSGRHASWDVPVDSGKGLSLESVCRGGRPSPPSRQPSKLSHQDSEEVQTKNNVLYRQYQEWEAEEQHMEALKRAERLAREIQQREEGTKQISSLQSPHLRKQDLLQDNKGQAYHQHQEMFRQESTETSSEINMLQQIPQQHGIASQHPSHQHPNHYSECQSHVQEAQRHQQVRMTQQHSKEGFAQDAHIAQPYMGLQSRHQDGLTQLPIPSSQLHKTHSTLQFSHDSQLIDREVAHQDQSYRQPRWPKEHQPTHESHLGPQHNQLMPNRDQQVTSLQSQQSFYPQFGAQELSQKTSDRSAQYAGHNQHVSGTAPSLQGSFPPLPAAASVNPPPPDSPPPPPPLTHPPIDDIPPPPPPNATYPSARSSTLQGLSGHSQDYLNQSSLSDGQGYGPLEVHRLQQSGVSQEHVSHLSQFQPPPPQHLEKSRVVDAVNIFRNPGRMMRPDRFVVILRGLPGSGKSYLAKALRDVEVMNGGSAPRIHSMDDYFTCEVEKEEVEIGSSSSRSKKKVVKRVMEYCYEPEMEEAYRASMLKAFRKTLEEGMFKFAIVDDRNVLIADFAQFWAIAKRSGYEAFILEAPYTDIKGCAARNVHNFTEQQIQSMSNRWQSTPSLYLKLDVSSLFRADDLNAQDIIEVDMDADDMERDLEDEEEENNQLPQDRHLAFGSQTIERPTTGDRWEDKNDTVKKIATSAKPKKMIEELGSGRESKRKSTDNALSGLMTTYGKKDKFVHWADNQGVKGSSTGFSIGSSQKTASLVIGPGPGYNGMSNLLVAGDDPNQEHSELKKSNKFVEQLRAEQEAFKAVFARRRGRIHGMDDEDDD